VNGAIRRASTKVTSPARAAADRQAGRVALQRGPLVYCIEETDNGADLNDILLPTDSELVATTDGSPFEGIPVIIGKAKRRDASTWTDELYRPAGTPMVDAEIVAIPYFLWANRTNGEMLTWVRAE